MNDDELRAILHREADQIKEGPDSWSRLESRWTVAPVRSAPRSFAFGALAIAVVMALVVGVVWIGRRDSVTHAASGPQQPMPSRIAAVTADSRLVVLDAASGRIIRTLAGDAGTFRFQAEIGVSSDGQTIYYPSVVPRNQGPECESGDQWIKRVPTTGGSSTKVKFARTVAVSATGLASSVDHAPCGRGTGHLAVSAGSGISRVYRGLAPRAADELLLDHLSWSPDGRHLAFQWFHGRPRTYVLDTRTATSINDAVCVCGQRSSTGWFGYLGGTGDFLGSRAPKVGSRAASRAVALRSDGSVRRTLFRSRGPISELASDRSGDHILAMFPKETKPGFFVDSLYRWSRGDKEPTKVRAGIIAAAWIPDSPRRPV